MRALVQRVRHASVTVDGELISSIKAGILIFLGVIEGDTEKDLEYVAAKCANLRIFDDEEGIPNLSVKDISGDVMVVSQFTLAASTRKGNRPSYIYAAKPDAAEGMYGDFCERIGTLTGTSVARGVFGADMKVDLLNDGPLTIWIDSAVSPSGNKQSCV